MDPAADVVVKPDGPPLAVALRGEPQRAAYAPYRSRVVWRSSTAPFQDGADRTRDFPEVNLLLLATVAVEEERLDHDAAQIDPVRRSDLLLLLFKEGQNSGLQLWGIDDGGTQEPRENSDWRGECRQIKLRRA